MAYQMDYKHRDGDLTYILSVTFTVTPEHRPTLEYPGDPGEIEATHVKVISATVEIEGIDYAVTGDKRLGFSQIENTLPWVLSGDEDFIEEAMTHALDESR